MKNIIPPVKGTRDFYPEQMAIRTWLYEAVRAVSESFGYQEWEAPLLETLDLYAAKSGEELVKEQSYVFTDRGGDMITLRPELTPSLARLVAQRQNELSFPLRWWSWGPFWRYERPQRGRTREFLQWNVDMIGVDSPEADAEVVTVLASLFQKVGLTPREVLILVNNRRLTDAQLEMIGIPKERRPAVMTWIDRRDKLTVDAWETYGREVGLSDEQIAKTKTMLADQDLWKQSEELVQFFKAIEALGLAQYIRFDPSIMRGLAYYTGTVFEAWEVGGDIKRSILGGGRYDNLLSDVGGSPLSAVGFAMGDVVMGLLMEKYGLAPKELKASPALVLVTVFDKERILDSMRLAADLRREGLNVICYPESAKLQKQFKFADRMGMKVALVVGPDEAAVGKVTIKNLVDGSQFTLERAGVVDAIKKILAAQ